MKILIQPDGGKPRPLKEGFADELEMQTFLRDHATLIPVIDIRLGTPPLLCIGWEVFAASGSEDLLYVDETGLLTVVETKLGRNSESRRKVVGQILEYAADTVGWSKTDFESRANAFLTSSDCPEEYRGKTLEAALTQFLVNTGSVRSISFSYPEFLNAVERNLQSGHLRLIIAVDEPPEPLRKIVDFVNRFSEHFEFYLFQLRRFRDEATKANIFVPELFGQVPTSPRKSQTPWDSETFLAQVAQRQPASHGVMQRLIAFCENEGAIRWGRGRAEATFGFPVPGKEGRVPDAFGGTDAGKVFLDFGVLSKWLDDELIRQYREDLHKVDNIPSDAIESTTWRNFDAALLADQEAWNLFVHAVRALQIAASERYASGS